MVLLQTCRSDATVCDPAQMAASSDQLMCCSGSEVLLQRSTRVGSAGQVVSMIADELLEDSKLKTFHGAASAAKLILPSWFSMFSSSWALAVLFAAFASSCPVCRGCITCLALVFLLLTCALVGLKFVLMHTAGPEPVGPMIQPPFKPELVVDATVPFTATEVNAPGPVHTAYLEGMQTVLDKRSGIPGLQKVESVAAKLAAAVLLQQAQPPVQSRLSLVYTLAQQDIQRNAHFMIRPALLAADLEDGLREAASKQTGADVPNVLTQIAQGIQPGAVDSAAKLKVNLSFQCNATHQLETTIRAAARIMISKHESQALRKLESTAHRTSGLPLRVASRCNDPSQKDEMQMCLGPGDFWVDFMTKEALPVPEHEDSIQNYVCKLGCGLGAALSSEKSNMIEAMSSHVVGLDENMFSQVRCRPYLLEGQKCNLHCG